MLFDKVPPVHVANVCEFPLYVNELHDNDTVALPITIFIVASFSTNDTVSFTLITTLYVSAGVVFVNDIVLFALLIVAPEGAPLLIVYV